MSLIIKNGRIMDPVTGRNEMADILITDGRIEKIGLPADISAERVIDAGGMIVAPGLMDAHVHFRDPGQTYKEDIFSLIHLKKKMPDKKLIFFLLFVYAGIILLFFLLKERIDLSAIRRSLLEKEGLNKDNFLFIFSYIILCNSFLEEAFFRGFLIEVFKKEGLYKAGSLYSAILFALYHIGIVASWFQPAVFLLCIVGLSLAGLFLEWICERNDTLLASYAVHAFANLAINTIGTFMMFM